MEDKPVTLSMKDWIIRNMSTRMNIPERIIEEVINHQMISARKALDTQYSLEFSGFGKLYFNVKKARTKLKKYKELMESYEKMLEDASLADVKKKSVTLKLNTATQEFILLKEKLHD